MAAIAKTIPSLNSTNGKTLDVVAYSGYAGIGIYDPSSMVHYGKTLPLPCVSTSFVAKTVAVPFLAALR